MPVSMIGILFKLLKLFKEEFSRVLFIIHMHKVKLKKDYITGSKPHSWNLESLILEPRPCSKIVALSVITHNFLNSNIKITVLTQLT